MFDGKTVDDRTVGRSCSWGNMRGSSIGHEISRQGQLQVHMRVLPVTSSAEFEDSSIPELGEMFKLAGG